MNDEKKLSPEEELEQKKEQFKASDSNLRMSSFAGMFKIRDNKALYKKRYPTGFNELDAYMTGGLTAGLHCLGAISSLGKSTFAMQIASNVAKNGIPVIFFSLEMKAVDLTAKAVSRQTYIDLKDGTKNNLAKSSDMMLTESIASRFSDEEWNVIASAAEKIEAESQNITIVECGSMPMTVDNIKNYVEWYVRAYNEKPFVVVDYLQIIDAPDRLKSATDKQVADYNLTRLKVLSDDQNIPILIVSSFNRENYDMEVSFKAFKDSGNIEYSCDSVLGLQLAGVGSTGFDVEKAKSTFPRKLELRVLKQRYGKTGEKFSFLFHTRYNYFEQDDQFVKLRDGQKSPFDSTTEDDSKQDRLVF